MKWLEIALKDSFLMLMTKDIHKIHKGYMILSEITVFALDILSVTHSHDVKRIYQCCCISKCNAINHDATSVESFIQTILGFYAMDV